MTEFKTQTLREWEEQNVQDFYDILDKMSIEDLSTLCFIFKCRPSYVGEPPEKHYYKTHLWSHFRDLTRERMKLSFLLNAMRSVGMNPDLPY